MAIPTFTSGQVLTAQELNQALTDTSSNAVGTITSGNGSLVGYNQGSSGAVQQTLQSKLQQSVSVLDFGADPTGVNDSYPAIVQALAGNFGRIIIPSGTYYLTKNPMEAYQNSITFVANDGLFNLDVSPQASFTGPGAGYVTLGGFMSPYTNAFTYTKGPYIRSMGDVPLGTDQIGSQNSWALEVIAPISGVTSLTGTFIGGDSNYNTTQNMYLCISNLVMQVRNADQTTAQAWKGLEIDMNISALDDNAAASNPEIFGLIITGGVTGSGYAYGYAGTGVLLARNNGIWNVGQNIQNCDVAFSINAMTGIVIDAEFNAATDSGIPSGPISRGIAIGNLASNYDTGQAIAITQLTNGSNTIQLYANTDTSSTGTAFRITNNASTKDWLVIGIDGSIACYAPSNSNGSTTSSGGIQTNGLSLFGESNLQLGQNFVSGAPTATGYLTIYDATGTAYNLLCAPA